MTVITIRSADARDRPAIEKLLRASWLTHWAPHVSAGSVARFHEEDPVTDYLDQHLKALDVLIADGNLAGVAHVVGDMLHALHIETARIGTGLGHLLLSHSHAKGARRLDVRVFNRRAHAFYLAHGWIEARRFVASEMGTHVLTIELVRDLDHSNPEDVGA